MRIAIIDLGTNSVRFDVHQLGPGKRVRLLHREKIMVRLGHGVFLHGKLDRKAWLRTLHAFDRFERVSRQLKASKIIAFGTSALREVSDRDKFVAAVRSRTGIDLRVISGHEEARLIAQGILRRDRKVLSKGKTALVDIGGGSTEISVVRGDRILFSHSFPLGTARLQQVFLKRSPPDADDLREMRVRIRNTLLQELLAARWPKVQRIVGSSGTVRALARILRDGKERETFDRDALEALNESISGFTTMELLGVEGMEAKRVDMILAGSVLLEEIMSVMGARKATPTEYSLRDGILDEELQLFQEGARSHLSIHLGDLLDKARGYGLDPAHLERGRELCSQLFDRLKPEHKLSSDWKIYLQSAFVLRDIGEHVGIADHAQHSAYIFRHTDLPPMEDWERTLIEALIRWHEPGKLELKALPFAKSRARHDALLRLIGLIRLADALDTGPETRIRIESVRRQGNQVRLKLGGKGISGLESLEVEARSPFLERVFGREFSIVSG